MPTRPVLPTRPVADPRAVLAGEHWRITVLTEGLVRLEWSEDGGFEDRASTFALNRQLPVPVFEVREDGMLEIVTSQFRLAYDRRPFSPQGLSVQATGGWTHHHSTWRYGDDELAPVNLGGTARTLDDADGAIPLEDGILSANGVAVLDDSRSFLFTEDGGFGSREPGRTDLYVFAYNRDYDGALAAFHAVSGATPLLPRWTLGNWWSRYHDYHQDEYLTLMDRFTAENLPFSVAVVDMDWHRVGSVPPGDGSGWTGYSWEPSLFPDPEAFLTGLHERGLHTTLNLHPADGVRSFEDPYPAMAERMGVDPASGTPVPFDITDPAFVEAYFDVLHHPLEEAGVDFWWIDWQQGHFSRVRDVDPLWLLNHLHFLDAARDGGPLAGRALTFSRYAGPGSHRYPVGFSGDTIITWDSLRFQPRFTATAANIGYGWWSHDIGGHIDGVRDDELMTRWVQLGVFSPVLRLHSTNNAFLLKEPWNYPAESRTAISEALRLRHRLVPYLHTMNHRAAAGTALVRPMYHLHPGRDEAYTVPHQFAFGSELLVAPITSPRDPLTRCGAVTAWLPPGRWTDVVSGQTYDGDRSLVLHRDLDAIPVLLADGGILPLAGTSNADTDQLDAAALPTALEVLIAPGDTGAFDLVEDDGTGSGPDTPTVVTGLRWEPSVQDDLVSTNGKSGMDAQPGPGRLVILSAEAHPSPDGTRTVEAADVVPTERTWTVTWLSDHRPSAVTVEGDPLEVQTGDAHRFSVTVTAPTDRTLVLHLTFDEPAPAPAPDRDALLARLAGAQWLNDAKPPVWALITSDRPIAAKLAGLQALDVPAALLGSLTELLTARD
ncbi:glycoside hydrolase family 31 protein [Tersicoccus sp. Bi-70]|uniref:glycoside hydrolase family 31 protein n=1 Tax=Tersicoccus sp. Bi-70 TaxID=1897634 RepID=UPI000975A7AF|nr:glycoside hydrolase family 31 protein [Tersicoccus sp. Bi-70]OMH36797.1 glycoside hydrolase [Tersicoccus sp. Bi-70]